MASIKNLKKDINYVLGDIIEECYAWELMNPETNNEASQAIINESIDAFDDLLDRMYDKDIEDKKVHYKVIQKDLQKKAEELINKINTL